MSPVLQFCEDNDADESIGDFTTYGEWTLYVFPRAIFDGDHLVVGAAQFHNSDGTLLETVVFQDAKTLAAVWDGLDDEFAAWLDADDPDEISDSVWIECSPRGDSLDFCRIHTDHKHPTAGLACELLSAELLIG
jgi:hypothetical protein